MFDNIFFYERGNRNSFYTFIIYKHTGEDRKTQAGESEKQESKAGNTRVLGGKKDEGRRKIYLQYTKAYTPEGEKKVYQEEMAHFSTAKKRKEEKKKTKPDEERKKTEEKNFRKGRRKRLQGFRKPLK